MNIDVLSDKMEKYISPFANKMSQQRHLKATRDAFMSILPITLFGSIPIIIKAAPVTDDTTNGSILAWANFANKYALILDWLSGMTINAMSFFICIGVTYCWKGIIYWYKQYKFSTSAFNFTSYYYSEFRM